MSNEILSEQTQARESKPRTDYLPNQSYQWLEEISSVAVFVCNINSGEILFMSKSVQNIGGYPYYCYEQGGLSFFASLVHPEDYGMLLNNYVEAISCVQFSGATPDENYSFTNQFRIWHKEQYWITIQTDVLVLDSTKNGEIKKVFGTLKKAEANRIQNVQMEGGNETTENLLQSKKPIPINLKKSPNEKITPRELEVLQLIGHGFSAKQIADKLYISIHTAINHRKNLIEKFQVKNTAELILEASKVYWL